jgi:hypothetical protein
VTDAEEQFAEPFNLHITGPDGAYVLHGVEFPSGRCVILDDPEYGLATAATSIEALLERYASSPEQARIVRPTTEETDQP